MTNPDTDLYGLLGISPLATTAEIRRAFRRLALLYHPDRAGPDATPIFQRIAHAYAVLADAAARAEYDVGRMARVGQGTAATPGDPGAWRARPARAHAHAGFSGSRAQLFAALRRTGKLLDRLSRPLDELIALGIASRDEGHSDSRQLELRLRQAEADRGGVALIDMALRVACSTCGGVARRGGFWCLRCDSTGKASETVTITCAIPAGSRDGDTTEIPTTAAGGLAPVRFRLRVAAAGV